MPKQTFTTGQVLLASQLTSLQQTAMNGGAFSAKTSSYTLVSADAGTAISMTSTSATTITVNTGLFAAGDTVLITNLGSGACVITAGTATVNTAGSLSLAQYEAGLLHFVSTSSAVFNDYVQAASNPLTTTGDMIYSSSGSTQARLGIGTTGQVLTVASGIPSWSTPSSSVTFSGARVTKSATQAVSNGVWTTVTFNTEQFDVDNYHSTTTNTSRLTIPTGKSGYFLIYASVEFSANVNGVREIAIAKNGTDVIYNNMAAISGSYVQTGQVSLIVNAVATDYFEILVYQDSGASININGGVQNTNFCITYLGA